MPKKKKNNFKAYQLENFFVARNERSFAEQIQQTTKQIAKKPSNLSLAPKPSIGKQANGERRQIDYEIKKNKGLTPKRKKECRNSRVKYRNKYNKAIKKFNHLKPGVKDRMNPVFYDGEASGINCNVIKSTKLVSA
jgi:U3 small nucleolar RNA-associated protein 3